MDSAPAIYIFPRLKECSWVVYVCIFSTFLSHYSHINSHQHRHFQLFLIPQYFAQTKTKKPFDTKSYKALNSRIALKYFKDTALKIWHLFMCIYRCDTGTLQSSPPSTSPSTSHSSSPDDSDSDLAFSVNRSSSASESSLGWLPNFDSSSNATVWENV